MTTLYAMLVLFAAAIAIASVWCIRAMTQRNMHLWLGSQLRHSVRRHLSRRERDPSAPIHVFICIADHFEPSWGGASDLESDRRVEAWVREYPATLGSFRDSDGRPPRHTFFYPIDQYEPRHVDALAGLCRQGYGEVEIHLHHDQDTAENLECTLHRFTQIFADRHGLLARWPDGRIAYGFVHGNWALDNSRPDGCWCGVNNELEVLQKTGCYADFTLPSAPSATQTRTINSIYYAQGREGCHKSHNRGVRACVGDVEKKGLLLIQGPLGLWWPRPFGLPRVENGCLQHGQEPSMHRLDQWIRAGVQVAGRPDWTFVKLHTHGAKEQNRRVLQGPAGVEFHRSLAIRAAQDPLFRYHYVTAREMYNLAKAAECGWSGPVIDACTFVVSPNCPSGCEEISGLPQIGALRPA